MAAWSLVLSLDDSAQAWQERAAAHASLGHVEEASSLGPLGCREAERDFAEALKRAESDEDAIFGSFQGLKRD